MPFCVFVSGEALPPLERRRLDGFESLRIVGSPEHLAATDRNAVVPLARPTAESLPPALIEVDGTDALRVIPRASIRPGKHPVVLHLLNHSVDKQPDGDVGAIRPLRGATLRVDLRLFHGQKPVAMRLHRVESDTAVDVPFSVSNGSVRIQLPALDIWGLLEIEAGDQSGNPLLAARRHAPPRPIPHSEVLLMRLKHGRNEPRPEWLEAAFAAGVDPLAEYMVSRISWSYGNPKWEAIQERGIDYVGSVNVGGTRIRENRPESWEGWARGLDGEPLYRRAEWIPPSVAGCWANEAFRDSLRARIDKWLDRGDDRQIDGLQWDEAGGAMNTFRVRGGDYHPDMQAAFRQWLAETRSPEQLARLGIDNIETFKISDRIEEARKRVYEEGFPELHVKRAPGATGDRALAMVTTDPDSSEPMFWALTPVLSTRADRVRIDVELQVEDRGDNPRQGLYVLGKEPPAFAATFFARPPGADSAGTLHYDGKPHDLPPAPEMGEWSHIQIIVDFTEQTIDLSVNGLLLSRDAPFRGGRNATRKLTVSRDAFRVGLLRRPNFIPARCGLIRVVEIE